MSFRKALPLHPGDSVQIVAPGGPVDRSSFKAGVEILAERYQPIYDDGIFAVDRYLAGSDSRRFEELSNAFADTNSRAVFCARGGYGAMRLLSDLSWHGMPNKALVGFSDITALHASIQAAGQVSIHGPGVAQLSTLPSAGREWLYRLLESTEPPPPLTGAEPLVPGEAEGPLIGGNLSVFTRLLGTRYLPSLEGAVLLLEDVAERPYRLDRMWTHLRHAGVFEQVAGIALGDFHRCEEREADYRASDVLLSLAHETGLPCALGFPIGHTERNLAVGLGCRVRLVADDGRLEFLEAAVAPEGAEA